MPTENYQLVALPIPEYLVSFLCGKLKTQPEILENGSKVTEFPITRRSFMGEFIINNLKPSKSFNQNQSNFYVKISDNASRRKSGIPDTRNTIVRIPQSKYLVIEKMLRNALETELVAHIKGSIFAYYELKGTTKGIVHKSIYQFMETYGIPFSQTTFETLKKIYQRAKKTPKPLKTLML